MAMFGAGAGGGASPGNWADVLSLIGAGLKDASPASQGGNLQAAQQMMFQRQMFQRQQQMLAGLPGLFGGSAPQASAPQAPQAPVMTSPGSGPTMKGPGDDGNPIGPAETAPTYATPPSAPAVTSGPDYNRIAQAAPLLKMMGIDVGASIEALKAGQPEVNYDRGFGYNKKTGGAMGGFHPDLGQGIGLTAAGAAPVPGYADAAAAIAGATTSAQEGAKAGWDLVDVPMGSGSPIKLPRAIAAPILARNAASRLGGAAAGATGAQGQPNASQFGVGQAPAEVELAKARAVTQGKNESDISGARSAMQQVDDQTNMIAQNLHDMLGESQDAKTGKWVKTKPSMISGLSTGSGTDLIEHIPFVNQSAKDLEGKIETVRNGTSFNSLQAIKNAMAAAGDGGGGSVRMTDQTARMLGEINGSLNQDQSGPQFEATVRRHLAQLDALSKARHDLFESQYQGIRPNTPGQTGPTANYNKPTAPAASSGRAAPQIGQVVRGYTYRGGDPHSPQSWAKN